MKKNKKGFTLVELLSVVVLIGLLTGIGVPGVMRISENMKERSLNTKIDLIENAAVFWGQDNKSLLQSDKDCEIEGEKVSCRKVLIGDLIDDDYLDGEDNSDKMTNPIDNTDMTKLCVYVYKKNNRVYAYYSGISCKNECEGNTQPVINMDSLETKIDKYSMYCDNADYLKISILDNITINDSNKYFIRIYQKNKTDSIYTLSYDNGNTTVDTELDENELYCLDHNKYTIKVTAYDKCENISSVEKNISVENIDYCENDNISPIIEENVNRNYSYTSGLSDLWYEKTSLSTNSNVNCASSVCNDIEITDDDLYEYSITLTNSNNYYYNYTWKNQKYSYLFNEKEYNYFNMYGKYTYEYTDDGNDYAGIRYLPSGKYYLFITAEDVCGATDYKYGELTVEGESVATTYSCSGHFSNYMSSLNSAEDAHYNGDGSSYYEYYNTASESGKEYATCIGGTYDESTNTIYDQNGNIIIDGWDTNDYHTG